MFHRCRADGIRRRIVPLEETVDDDAQVRRFDARRDWFTANYPVPPPPDNRKARS